MSLDDELQEIDITQRTEMEGLAREHFDDTSDDKGMSKIDMKTNLHDEEIGLCLINDIVFNILEMGELSPTRQFKRLTKSRGGWGTEQFVRMTQGVNDNRQGTGFMQKMGGLFQPKQ